MPNNSFSNTCTLCGKKAECKCERCSDFYCSEDCQTKDWRNHRFICMPMPRLVNVGQGPTSKNLEPKPQIAAKDTKLSKSGNRLPNGSCVILTGFSSSNRCHIRSTNPTIHGEHEKILNEVNEYGKISTPLSDRPKVKSYALTLKNNKWYRVEILGNSNNNCYRVSFLDSGEISTRSLKELHKCAPSISNLPCYVRSVQLKNVTNCNDHIVMKAILKYVNKEYKVDFLKADNVELFQWGTTNSLNSLIQNICSQNKCNDINDGQSIASSSNTEINKNGMSNAKGDEIKTSKPINENTNKNQTSLKSNINGTTNDENFVSKSSSAEGNTIKNNTNGLSAADSGKIAVPRQLQMLTPCLVPPFDIIPVEENATSSKVMIMDCSYIESGYIGCLSCNYVENFKEVTTFLSQYDVGNKPYKPKFNEYCLANFEQEWYRAKVVEVLSENKFLVVYIDFTNESEVSSESIRHYPPSLTKPCCTSMCAIDGLPEDISEEQKKFLELTCVPFQLLNIDSVRVKDDIRYVKCNELLNKMRNSKLL